MRLLECMISFSMVCALTAAPTRAQQTAENPRTPITIEALRDELKRSSRGGAAASHIVISGKDLVTLLEDGTPVRIEDCVIEGGIVFPESHVVTVPFALVGCSLEPAPGNLRALWNGHSIYARGTRFSREVDFSGTTFMGHADFANVEFEKQASFSRSLFRRLAGFSGTKFRSRSLFNGASFEHAEFRNAVFHRGATFGLSRFPKAAKFDGAVFEKSANFGQATFSQAQRFAVRFNGYARFKQAEFKGSADFSNANFAARVSFEKAKFGGDARFGGIAFSGLGDFQEAVFEKSAEFSRSNFRERANFHNAVFKHGADFTEAGFTGTALFQSANFQGESDFSNSHFSKEVSFVGARFRALVFFSSMVAEQFASFRGAVFDDEVGLAGAVFGTSGDFQGTTFRDEVTFTNTDLGVYADFRDAQIDRLELYSVHNPTILRSRMDLRGARIRAAHFQDVIFENTVDFSDATFGLPLLLAAPRAEAREETGSTIFRFVTFESDVFFARTRFAGQLALENVKFRRTVDFTDASFSDINRTGVPSFAVSYVDFEDLRINWGQLPEPRYWVQSGNEAIRGSVKKTAAPGAPEPISRTLAKLEKHFRDGNHLQDANHAYYQRKVAELEEARSKGWDTRRLVLEFEWLFWGLICGYGTKLAGAITSAVVAVVLFALIFWKWATVKRQPHPGTEQEHSFRLRLLDFPKQFSTDPAALSIESPRTRKFIDSLRVSAVILFKVGYRDTTVSGSLGPLPMATIIAFEWFLGFYFLAAITVTLANTQPLVNRLVTGVL